MSEIQANGEGMDASGGQDRTWTEEFGDDEREFVSNKGWASPGDLLESYRHLERMVGADTVRLPRANASSSEVGDFWSRLGRPETPDGYDLPVPGNVPGYSEEMAGWFRKAAHAANMPADMAQRLHDQYVERFIDEGARIEALLDQETREAEHELRAEWGPDFARRQALANRAVRSLGGDALFAELEEVGLANSPALVRAFAAAGEKLFTEDDFIDSGGADGFGISPEASRAEIRRLRADSAFMAAYGDRQHPEHQAAQDRMDQLYAAAREGG